MSAKQILMATFVVSCMMTFTSCTDDISSYNKAHYFIDDNPTVTRLPEKEIKKSRTPEAIAYNFVMAIYNRDYNNAAKYMTKESARDWRSVPVETFDSIFSAPGKLNIQGWKEGVEQGYEVAVTYVYDETRHNYLQTMLKVYVECVPSSQIDEMGFQDIERWNNGETNVKVLLVPENGKWRVYGFK